MAKKVACVCSLCSQLEYEDEHGLFKSGKIIEARYAKQHMADDRRRQDRERMGKKAIQGVILLQTADRATDHSRHLQSQTEVCIEETNGRSSSPPYETFEGGTSSPLNLEESEDRPQSLDIVTPLENLESVSDRMRTLSTIQSELDIRRSRFDPAGVLQFASLPECWSEEPVELRLADSESFRVAECITWVASQTSALSEMTVMVDKDAEGYRRGIIKQMQEFSKTIDKRIRDQWALAKVRHLYKSRPREGAPCIYHTESRFTRTDCLEPFVLAALFSVVVMHSIASANRLDCEYWLATIRVVLFGAFAFSNLSHTLTAAQKRVLDSTPLDVRTAIASLGLEPEIIRYACCSQCCAIYPPDPNNSDEPYPFRCTWAEPGASPCGSPLVEKKVKQPKRKGDEARDVFKPIRNYAYRSLTSWLADMFARSDFEASVVSSWDESPARSSSNASSDWSWEDIMHSPAIRTFLGPDKKTLYSVQKNGEVHLVFSLFVDWFNPFSNKKGGKSHSIGAIYLACLNLPPDVRYRPENIFLAGIIPGPKEPSLHEINHLLRPLVDELIKLWHQGVYFNRTASCRFGRLVRVAIIPLVCDLPALRKTAGFAGHSSVHFCSFCLLKKKDMNNTDRAAWPAPLTWNDHLVHAREWRDAESARRNQIFETWGVRWSELLRLPYWDPTRFAVIDTMHNLFLGELKHHCVEVWGIDVKEKSGGPSKIRPHTPEQQKRYLEDALHCLMNRDSKKLSKIRKGYITSIARLNGIAPTASGSLTKASYVKALIDWVQPKDFDFEQVKIPPVLESDTADFHVLTSPLDLSRSQVLSGDVLAQIRQDILDTYLPSWMEKPPSTFGSLGHGKLKADQWRTVCTVNLVITLVRLWSGAQATTSDQILLANFLHLVIAVDLAARRTMSPSRAQSVDIHMYAYVRGLRDLFEHSLVPNHHLALHLKQCLLDFGPVHGWWAFPFERYNGILQRFRSNNKPGKMPLTFMRYFYIGTNIRWLAETMKWPILKVYVDLFRAYLRRFQSNLRGSNTTASLVLTPSHSIPEEYDETKEKTLPLDMYAALLRIVNSDPSLDCWSSIYDYTASRQLPFLPPTCQYIPRFWRGGMAFATRQKGKKNSFVLFRPRTLPGTDDPIRAGQIKELMLHRRTVGDALVVEPVALIEEYVGLSPEHVSMDPYRRHAELETRLYYNTFTEKPHLVWGKDILCHFAALVYTPEDIGRECIVARSLDRT